MSKCALLPRLAAFARSIPDINWDDISQAHSTNAPFLAEVASDKELLRDLLTAARYSEAIWSKCEEGVVEDKIVLWDDPARGCRLRLRMATAHQEEMAHQHRFSSTNYVLRSAYLHRAYTIDGPLDDTTDVDDVLTVCIHEDTAGDCFTIHHEAVHSTPFPQPDTITLVLRGPAMKDRAPVLFMEPRGNDHANRTADQEPDTAKRGHMFWRVGEKDESPERRAERRMTHDTYTAWLARFEEYRLI